MEGRIKMGALLGTVGTLGFIVSLIWGIVSAIRKTGKAKKVFLFAAGFFILIIIGLSITPDPNTAKSIHKNESIPATAKESTTTKQETNQKEEAPKPVELTPRQKMLQDIKTLIDSKQAFDTGSYIQGDIPAGEYAFVSFEGSGKYYSEKDGAGNIIDNENFDSFGYVYVHAAGNLETRGVLINVSAFPQLGVSSAKEIYEKLNSVQDYKDSAWYKVGVDIPAGHYVIESYGQGYVAIMAGPVGKSNIIDNDNFNGRYSVNVTNGQYLKISGAKITQ